MGGYRKTAVLAVFLIVSSVFLNVFSLKVFAYDVMSNREEYFVCDATGDAPDLGDLDRPDNYVINFGFLPMPGDAQGLSGLCRFLSYEDYYAEHPEDSRYPQCNGMTECSPESVAICGECCARSYFNPNDIINNGCGSCYDENGVEVVWPPHENGPTNSNSDLLEKMWCLEHPEDCDEVPFIDPQLSCFQIGQNQDPPLDSEYCFVDDEVCVGGLWVNSVEGNRCCFSGSCYMPSDSSTCAENQGFLCSVGQVCSPPTMRFQSIDEYTSTAGECCGDEAYCYTPASNIYSANEESFMCYQDRGQSYFAECCSGTSCWNKYNLTNPDLFRQGAEGSHSFRMFTTGSSLHSLETFNTFVGGVDFTDNIYRIRDLPAQGSVTLPFVNLLRFSNTGKSDWSSFQFFIFDVLFTNSISTIEILYSDPNIESLSLEIESYATKQLIPGRWTRIKIPLSAITNLQDIDKIVIHGGESETNILLDNFALISETNDALSTRYCAGYFGKWIEDVEPQLSQFDVDDFRSNINNWGPYKYVCDHQMSFGWSGTQCCGDDNIVGSTVSDKEFYVDLDAGCWEGIKVGRNDRLYDVKAQTFDSGYPNNLGIVFSDNSFYSCGYDSGSKQGITSIQEPLEEVDPVYQDYCSVKGPFYCEYGNVWLTNDRIIDGTNPQSNQKSTVNLLTDGGFEMTDLSGQSSHDNVWYLLDNADPNVLDAETSSVNFYGGSKSFMITSTQQSWEGVAQNIMGVQPGEKYELSAWVSEGDAAYENMKLEARWRNSDGTLMNQQYNLVAESSDFVVNGFRRVSAIREAQSDLTNSAYGAQVLALLNNVAIGSEVYFDNIQLRKTSLIQNGNFEVAAYDDNTQAYLWNGGELSTDFVNSGQKAIKVSDSTPATQTIYSISAQKEYVLSGYVVESGEMTITWFNETNPNIETTIFNSNLKDANNYFSENYFSPAGAKSAIITLTSTTGNVWFDQVELTPANDDGAPFFDNRGSYQSCCPADKCWDGSSCVPPPPPPDPNDPPNYDYFENNDPNLGTAYKCDNGDWSLFYHKVDYDNTGGEGYCPDISMCFHQTETETKCYSSGEYVPNEDYVCEDGSWSSRTKYAAATLLDIADIDELDNFPFVLTCDPTTATGAINGGILADNFEGIPVCSLKLGDNVIVATHVDVDIATFITSLGGGVDCTDVGLTEIESCEISQEDNPSEIQKFYFDDDRHLAIYSKWNGFEINDVADPEIMLKPIFNLDSRPESIGSDIEFGSLVDKSNYFRYVYIKDSRTEDGSKIKVLLESPISPNPYNTETFGYEFDTDNTYVKVIYEHFNEDLCSEINSNIAFYGFENSDRIYCDYNSESGTAYVYFMQTGNTPSLTNIWKTGDYDVSGFDEAPFFKNYAMCGAEKVGSITYHNSDVPDNVFDNYQANELLLHDFASSMSCCELSKCWEGTTCKDGTVEQSFTETNINSTVFDFDNEYYACQLTDGVGDWTELKKKYHWDRDEEKWGFCLDNTDCWIQDGVHPIGCVDSGTYYDDNYCLAVNDGEGNPSGSIWTTRTALVASYLGKIANTEGPEKYTIFCDEIEIVVNQLPGGFNSENYNGKLCTLKYADGDSEKVVIGASVQIVGETEGQILVEVNDKLNALVQSEDDIDCADVFEANQEGVYSDIDGTTHFGECTSGSDEWFAYYNPIDNLTIISKDNVGDAIISSFWSNFWDFILNPFGFFSGESMNVPRAFDKTIIIKDDYISIIATVDDYAPEEPDLLDLVSEKFEITNSPCPAIEQYDELFGNGQRFSCEQSGGSYIFSTEADSDAFALGEQAWPYLTSRLRTKPLIQD